MSDVWIGVDLDATLAEYHGWLPDGGIGKPIPRMIQRVKTWLDEGRDVRIFTARVSPLGGRSDESGADAGEEFCARQREIIAAWCQEHLGRVLPMTYQKDFRMLELWDDRAVQVVPNTGIRVDYEE